MRINKLDAALDDIRLGFCNDRGFREAIGTLRFLTERMTDQYRPLFCLHYYEREQIKIEKQIIKLNISLFEPQQ